MCDLHTEIPATKEVRVWADGENPSTQHIVCTICADKLIDYALEDGHNFAVNNLNAMV